MDFEYMEMELREDYMAFWHMRWISYPFLFDFGVIFLFLTQW